MSNANHDNLFLKRKFYNVADITPQNQRLRLSLLIEDWDTAIVLPPTPPPHPLQASWIFAGIFCSHFDMISYLLSSLIMDSKFNAS